MFASVRGRTRVATMCPKIQTKGNDAWICTIDLEFEHVNQFHVVCFQDQNNMLDAGQRIFCPFFRTLRKGGEYYFSIWRKKYVILGYCLCFLSWHAICYWRSVQALPFVDDRLKHQTGF